MANKRRAGSRWKGTTVTGAAKRAVSSSQRVQKDAKSAVKPAENFVRADRNASKGRRPQEPGKLGQKVLLFADTAKQKKDLVERVIKPGKALGQVKKNPRTATGKAGPSMTDRVFRPMTRRQAAQVSEVMRDLPSTKLPPRL
ncbi:hypothetical protein ACFYSF_22710 [Streptomyces canus]|uniref:hypothetical protein n=1 Tax=Streptomyces canus TaxID=58343 RepID=UPI0036A74CE7